MTFDTVPEGMGLTRQSHPHAPWRRATRIAPAAGQHVVIIQWQGAATTTRFNLPMILDLPKDAVAAHCPRVAVLEDDAELRERILIPGLEDFGFQVVGTGTAAELYRQMVSGPFDIIVLDLGLPDEDGLSVARYLRSVSSVGLVMLTGSQERNDRIRALQESVDAFLTKPVDVDVLAATIHSLARRLHQQPTATTRRWELESNGWCLVSPSRCSIALTKTERRLSLVLMDANGATVTREQLIASFTSNVFDFDMHRLDSMIHRLRRKVADTCGETLPLVAVHGEGYAFNATP